MKIRLEIKDSDGIKHRQDCDDYAYNVDTRSVLCYEVDGETKILVAAYEDVSHFRRVEPEPTKPEEVS